MPPVNPWIPVGDIGAPQFVETHPTFDGRGVVVGIVDDGVDLLTPELQVATAPDGTPTDKVVDYVATTDPEADVGRDPTWVTMDAEVHAVDGHFMKGGRTFTAPHDGTFRFGFFDERAGVSRPSGSMWTATATPAGAVGCSWSSGTTRPARYGWTPIRTSTSRPRRP